MNQQPSPADFEIINPQWLFLKTCQELVGKSKSPEHYSKLRMAGLLRHLLLGPRSLLAMTNPGGGVAIEFGYREPEASEGASWETPRGFDAAQNLSAGGVERTSDLTAFLGARVVYLGGQWLTVEQLLTSVDHAYGGAYLDIPEEVSKEALVAFDGAVRAGARGVVSMALHEITGVVLRALIPMVKEGKAAASQGADAAAAMPPAGSGCPFSGQGGDA